MKTNLEIAKEVLEGKWGNGSDRKKRLTEAGYNYDDVQGIVNALLNDTYHDVSDTDDAIVSDEPVLEIKGTETMEVEVDLNKYNSIKLVFKVE